MSAEDLPDVPPDLETERRRAFWKGVTVAAAFTVATAAVPLTFIALSVIPKFRDVFKSVGVDMPGITLLIVKFDVLFAFFPVFLAAGCAIGALKCKDRWAGVAGILISLILLGVWTTMLIVGLFQPLVSLLQGLGQKPGP